MSALLPGSSGGAMAVCALNRGPDVEPGRSPGNQASGGSPRFDTPCWSAATDAQLEVAFLARAWADDAVLDRWAWPTARPIHLTLAAWVIEASMRALPGAAALWSLAELLDWNGAEVAADVCGVPDDELADLYADVMALAARVTAVSAGELAALGPEGFVMRQLGAVPVLALDVGRDAPALDRWRRQVLDGRRSRSPLERAAACELTALELDFAGLDEDAERARENARAVMLDGRAEGAQQRRSA